MNYSSITLTGDVEQVGEYDAYDIADETDYAPSTGVKLMGTHPIVNDIRNNGFVSSHHYDALMSGAYDSDLGNYYSDVQLASMKQGLYQQVNRGQVSIV